MAILTLHYISGWKDKSPRRIEGSLMIGPATAHGREHTRAVFGVPGTADDEWQKLWDVQVWSFLHGQLVLTGIEFCGGAWCAQRWTVDLR